MEGLNDSTSGRAGAQNYPEVVGNTLAVFYDSQSDLRECVKFKKIRLDGELV